MNEDQAALLRVHDVLAGSAKALPALIDCTRSDMTPPESLAEAAEGYIAEPMRFKAGA